MNTLNNTSAQQLFFQPKSSVYMNGVFRQGNHPNILISASSTQYLEQPTKFFENNRSNPTGMDIFGNFDHSFSNIV